MTYNTQVPDDWEVVRLGAIAEINRGVTWSSEQESSIPLDKTFPVLRIGNVQRHGFQMDDMLYVRGIADADRNRRSITSRTLVMVGSNGNRDRVGNVFLANRQVIGHLLASFLIGINPSKDVSEHFLFSSLHSAQTQSLITESTAGSTGLKNLSLSWLRNLTISLPPLTEQRAIAAVLDSIDEAIERTEAVIAATERLRDALLHELLTRGVPGWHSEWKEAPGIGTIPACWDVVRLGEMADVVMGQSPSGQHCNRSGYGTPLLNGPTEFARVHPIPAQWTTAPAKMASCGDLLFCVRGATAGRMNWANYDYAIGRGVAALRHHVGTRYQRYLRALVERMLPGLLTTVTGSTFPNLGRDEISNLRVLNPPLPEQQAIVAVLDSVDEPIERVREERDVLQSFRAAASDALLTGRVRTAVDHDM